MYVSESIHFKNENFHWKTFAILSIFASLVLKSTQFSVVFEYFNFQGMQEDGKDT